MSNAVVVALLLPILVLAGCADRPSIETMHQDPEPSPSPTPSPSPAALVAPNGTFVQPKESPPSGNWTTFVVNGRMNLSGPMYGPDTRFGFGASAANVFLPPDTTAVILELVWQDSLVDLDVEFIAPRGTEQTFFPLSEQGGPNGYYANREGRIGAPDSASRLHVPKSYIEPFQKQGCASNGTSQSGDCNVWDVAYRTKEGGRDIAWTLYATVFMGMIPPQNFTAIPTSP